MNRKRREKKAANKARRKRGKEAVLVEIEKAFDESRRYYSKLWSKDAAYFAENGHYDWMASFVSGQRFVLEVGTGEASGTLALIKGGAVVVSVDENPLCLDQAEQKLRDQGVSVSAERRSRFVNVAGKWPVAYDPPNATAPEEGVVLLEGGIGNVGVDPELHNWLRSVDPFDAIVCWNIGTHQLRFEEIGDIAKYRLIVQNRVYEIADEILRPGGILHIVDRGRVALSWFTVNWNFGLFALAS